MTTGWIAWTCLLLAANAGAADDLAPMNQRKFKIPIRLQPGRQADVNQMLLYLSRNQGQKWEQVAAAAPDKTGFEFDAREDGAFWFSIAVVYKNGIKDPIDPSRASGILKVLVDTIKPEVRIASAERMGEEIMVHWEVIDANPDWASLRLEHQVGNSSDWVPLKVYQGSQGNIKFRPSGPGDVKVRLALKDVAGNEGVAETVVRGTATAGAMVDRAVIGAGAVEGSPRVNGGTPPPSPVGSTLSLPVAALQNVEAKAAPPAPVHDSATVPLAHSSAQESGPMPARVGELPPVKILNKKQVKLDFNVVKYGPSGLGSVDVYVTTDEGASWAKAEGKPEVTLPVSTETRNPSPVRGSVTVQLPREGIVYGFYLVVKSRAGLSKPAPSPGTRPHVRIEVDTTMPVADLLRPQADTTGRADTLVLMWKASDKNLALNPISLEWAANPEGPWAFIGDQQLPNTGRYAWTITDTVPPKVFLKLTVRDTAGNVAVAQTREPVLIDLIEPDLGSGDIGVTVH